MSDPRVEKALTDLETTANSFAVRFIRMVGVRRAYVEQILKMSSSVRAAVDSGELSPQKGAEIANQMRNEILQMQRSRDFDLGRSLAQKMKSKGLTLDECIAKAMKNLKLDGRQFNQLTESQQRQVFLEVISASGRSRPAVTQAIPRLRWASRGLWLATLLIAGYNIGTSENPKWQTGREASNVAGGTAGGFAGGAAMGALGGIWAGPVGVAIGILVGGLLGALLADHSYVESVGTSDPLTRSFVGRFTGFWTGVDETGMARALVTEYGSNLTFVQRVICSLDNDYHTDADDVAVEYVKQVRKNSAIAQSLRENPELRAILIRVMDEGYTSHEESEAIKYLRGL